MGAALALAIVVGLAIKRRTRVLLLGSGLLLATVLVASEWERFVSFKRDKNLSAQQTAESVMLRPILARVAWNMFLDRPLLGCGLAQYPTQCIYYLNDRTTELPLEKARIYIQHNVFLALLTETGLIGMGLFALLLWLWVRNAWALWQSRQAPLWARQQGLLFLGLMATYLVNAMFHDVSRMPAVNMLLFFMAGVTAGVRSKSESGMRREQFGSRNSEVGSRDSEVEKQWNELAAI
jgi:O-antigen ligase